MRMKRVLEDAGARDPTPGEMLRAFRKRDGFTLADMKAITGIDAGNLSKLEHDHMPMTQHDAEIFAAALKVRPEAFLYPDGKFAKDKRLLEIERRAELKRHG